MKAAAGSFHHKKRRMRQGELIFSKKVMWTVDWSAKITEMAQAERITERCRFKENFKF